MKRAETSEALRSIHRWYRGEGSLGTIAAKLGTSYRVIENFLGENDLCTIDGRPTEGVPVQHIIDCLLLWLAMRKR